MNCRITWLLTSNKFWYLWWVVQLVFFYFTDFCWSNNKTGSALLERGTTFSCLHKESHISALNRQIPKNQNPESVDVIKTSNIVELLHVLHDCKGGNCELKEGVLNRRIEQEPQKVKSTFIKHRLEHKIYIINKYRITHSSEKFDLWTKNCNTFGRYFETSISSLNMHKIWFNLH